MAHVIPIIVRQQIVRDVPEVARQMPVPYLPGPFPLTTSPLEFHGSTKVMADAYEASRAFLAEVKPRAPASVDIPHS